MAVELTVYEDQKRIYVHTLTCSTVSSVARKYQSSTMIRVGPGWRVFKCPKCNPQVFVVQVSHATFRSTRTELPPRQPFEQLEPQPKNERWENKEGSWSGSDSRKRLDYWNKQISRNNPDSSFPPYGVVALDITHSVIRCGLCYHPQHHHFNNRGTCDDCDCPFFLTYVWQEDANCLSDDERLGPWLIWLYTGDHTEHWTLTIQKVVCSQCSVRAECLEQGVWGNETWGVWGGATERERKLLRAKWIKEGRVDERPNRPRNPQLAGDHIERIRRENGSGVATTRDDNEHRTGEESGESEAASEGVSTVPSEREVRWPRTYGGSEQRWGGEDGDYWRGSWETGG